jgi:hypothetical protein
MRGYFAVLLDMVEQDVVQSGFGSYESAELASEEARSWAIAENLPCDRSVVAPMSVHRRRL